MLVAENPRNPGNSCRNRALMVSIAPEPQLFLRVFSDTYLPIP